MYFGTAIQAEGNDFRLSFAIPQCKDSTIQIGKKRRVLFREKISKYC